MSKYNNRPYYVVMFVSRNKDNKHIVEFHQRTKAFLTQKNSEELKELFHQFVNNGCQGEISRMYLSVNSRKHEIVLKSLQHYLLDHVDINLACIDSLIASLAMKPGTAATKRFLFDFDNNSFSDVKLFLNDIRLAGYLEPTMLKETPNGYAVVTKHGFDTRVLLEKWECAELKRDGMLFEISETKEE